MDENKKCNCGWRYFSDELPQPGQDIVIVWPSGKYKPEVRQLTAEDLRKNWDNMRWMPIPEYR